MSYEIVQFSSYEMVNRLLNRMVNRMATRMVSRMVKRMATQGLSRTEEGRGSGHHLFGVWVGDRMPIPHGESP